MSSFVKNWQKNLVKYGEVLWRKEKAVELVRILLS